MNCLDCSGPISTQNRTGRCKRCSARHTATNPEYIAKRAAAFNARIANDPAFRAKRAREIHMRHMAARRDPVKSAKMLAATAENRKYLLKPESRQKWLAGRAVAGRRRHETVMAWCPPEYREEYRFIREKKRIPAAEARQMILAKLSPFERQMQAVRNGAKVVAKPNLRRSDYDFTLGGVTGALT